MRMRAIQIKDVSKKYNTTLALDTVSLCFEQGKIYGLLGRNGAGKSTLINIISNRIFPSHGEVVIDKVNIKESDMQEKLFCMSDADLYDPNLKVKEHFKWIDRFYDTFDLELAHEIAKKFNLDLNKKFKSLSKGYRSIFKLTIALALNVPYVIYDEPVLGLDANHRELFYNLLLQNFEDNPKTIIIATHLIEEVATIIEEVVLIDKGKVLLQESVETLLQKGYCVSGTRDEVDAYCQDKKVIGYDELGNLKLAYILETQASLPKDSNLQISNMNLQKLFVKLTEKGV